MCATNHHEYISLVLTTIRSCPHSWLYYRFWTKSNTTVSLVEQKLFTFLEHLSSHSFFYMYYSSWIPVVYIVKWHVFTFSFLSCNVRCDFRVKRCFVRPYSYLNWWKLLFIHVICFHLRILVSDTISYPIIFVSINGFEKQQHDSCH